MGYLGYKPADKPLTSADITDSIITSAKITDATIVNGDIANATIALAKLSATGTPSATTFLRGDNTFAVPASGDFVRLSTQTISSAVSSVDFTSAFTSTYDVYVINFSNVVLATDNVSFIGRVITGTNTVQTATEYGTLGTAVGITSAGSQSINDAYDWGTYGYIYFTWNTTFDNAATSGINGQLKFYNPNSTTLWKTIYQDTTYYGQDNRIWSQKINNIWRNATAITGFRFLADSGNISSGVFSLYAYKKS